MVNMTFEKNFFLSGGDDDYQDNEDKICEDFLPIRRDDDNKDNDDKICEDFLPIRRDEWG